MCFRSQHTAPRFQTLYVRIQFRDTWTNPSIRTAAVGNKKRPAPLSAHTEILGRTPYGLWGFRSTLSTCYRNDYDGEVRTCRAR